MYKISIFIVVFYKLEQNIFIVISFINSSKSLFTKIFSYSTALRLIPGISHSSNGSDANGKGANHSIGEKSGTLSPLLTTIDNCPGI